MNGRACRSDGPCRRRTAPCRSRTWCQSDPGCPAEPTAAAFPGRHPLPPYSRSLSAWSRAVSSIWPPAATISRSPGRGLAPLPADLQPAAVQLHCDMIPRPVAVKDSLLSEPLPKSPIVTEVVIIGAGPCGLFQVFELGLLGIGCHLVDSLGAPGGQCTELYPDKPIYDIPALPVCGAQELVDRLMQQIAPFNAPLHLGQEVTALRKREDGRFEVETILGTRFDAGAVVIAGGVGSFQPRRLGTPGAEAFEGRNIHYRVRDAAQYHGKKLAIFGGGDSALDWVIDFAGKAAQITHVHRRSEFKAAPASVAKMRALAAAGTVRYIEGLADSLITDGGTTADSFK